MYRILLIILLILPLSLFSQKKVHELGVLGGVSYYMGDINPRKIFHEVEPAFGLVYRLDLNSRYALRFSGLFGSLRGSDASSDSRYQITRNHSFNIRTSEFASMFEFHFFSYKPDSKYEFITPYVAIGLGVVIIPGQENSFPVKPVIPFGIGCKYAFNKRIGIAAEWTYRKTFSDYIDQLPNDEYTQTASFENKQRSFLGSKDWYSFAGISLTYKFAIGSSKCPAYRY
jgi:hypothetical protein